MSGASPVVDWRAYDFRAAWGFAPHAQLLRRVVRGAKLGNGQRVLDFGCGPGLLLRALGELGITCHVTGLDISAQALHWAHKEAEDYAGTAEFHEVDLDRPVDTWPVQPAAEELYDAVICNHSAYAFELPHLLRKLARFAKPGAPIIITVFQPGATIEPVLALHRRLTGTGVPAELEPLIRKAPSIMDAYREYLLTDPVHIQRQFWLTGWNLAAVRTAYAGQDWLIVAHRSTSRRIKVWRARTPQEIWLARATRYELFSSMEPATIAGKRPGDPLDDYDLLPGTGYVLATYGGLPIAAGRVQVEPPFQSVRMLLENGVEAGDPYFAAEAMRVGVFPEFRGPGGPGRVVVPRIMALLTGVALRAGCTHYVATILTAMVIRLLDAGLPWVINPKPARYPPEDRGPSVDAPVWLGTLDFAEALLVARHLHPWLYRLMGGDAAIRRLGLPAASFENLLERMAQNRQWVTAYMAGWNAARQGATSDPEGSFVDKWGGPDRWAEAYLAGYAGAAAW